MNIAKFKSADIRRMYIHYARSEKDVEDMELKLPTFNPINPTLTKNNYNLHGRDMLEEIEEAKKKYYVRGDDTVIFASLCITYPENCSVPQEEFFRQFYDIARRTNQLKHCVGAYVHMDENVKRPTMHYVFMPIEEKEITKTKRVKEYDEKKKKEVTRKKTLKYQGQFNAKAIINRPFLNALHYYFQRKINERGIGATIITPERLEFNRKRDELLHTYSEQIKMYPERKEEFLNEFHETLRNLNPKFYKRKAKSKFNWFSEFEKEANAIIEEANKESDKILGDVKDKYDYYIKANAQLKTEKTQLNEEIKQLKQDRAQIRQENKDLIFRRSNMQKEEQDWVAQQIFDFDHAR